MLPSVHVLLSYHLLELKKSTRRLGHKSTESLQSTCVSMQCIACIGFISLHVLEKGIGNQTWRNPVKPRVLRKKPKYHIIHYAIQ